ncbi:MAG: hypothetical protein ACT6QM_05920 [Brevundimonas mediterranea]|uniref:hypothetical protein n=1 Tax=Brevundimonas mediterranea TaxID=74329 RepID=UPI004033542C
MTVAEALNNITVVELQDAINDGLMGALIGLGIGAAAIIALTTSAIFVVRRVFK